MDRTFWSRGKQEKLSSFVAGELNFLETGLSFGWFQWECVKIFLKANTTTLLFLRSNVSFGL